MKFSLFYIPIYYILFALFSSCSNYKQPEKTEDAQQAKNLNSEVFDIPIMKFSIPYDKSLNCDSNNLIFLKESNFDTSYLLHISRQGSKLRGVYYMVLPQYHRDLEDYYDKEQELLFFEGFSFKLNNMQWEIIKKKTEETISKMIDSSRSGSTCFDCPSYSIFYNKKRRVSGNSKLQDDFKSYDVFLRNNFINQILKERSSVKNK